MSAVAIVTNTVIVSLLSIDLILEKPCSDSVITLLCSLDSDFKNESSVVIKLRVDRDTGLGIRSSNAVHLRVERGRTL